MGDSLCQTWSPSSSRRNRVSLVILGRPRKMAAIAIGCYGNFSPSIQYHKLSKQYHPDRLPSLPNQQDAHTTFAAIANAYEVLKDPDKRMEYNLIRSLRADMINPAFNVDDADSGSEEEKVFSKCDWCQIVDCNFPQLKPLKCTVDGCNNLVHHLCQIEFKQREGFPETLLLKCCLHQPQSEAYPQQTNGAAAQHQKLSQAPSSPPYLWATLRSSIRTDDRGFTWKGRWGSPDGYHRRVVG